MAFKFFSFLVFIFIFSFSVFNFALAQTAPQFLASWQAQNYVPSWYVGKIFPTYSSKINVRFDLIENGKLVDLSNSTCERKLVNNVCELINDGQSHPCRVRWYVNDDLNINENDGFAIKTFSFANRVYGGNDAEVHISIPNYHCQSLDKIITISVKSPELAIEAPYGQKVGKNKNNFIAWPFFLNSITGLSFQWMMDGQKVGDNSPFLTLNVDPATLSTTNISLEAQAQNEKGETAKKEIQLEVK